MKLGYLRIPSAPPRTPIASKTGVRDDRAQCAQALGFTEFYGPPPGPPPVCPPRAAWGPEHRKFLQLDRKCPARRLPELVAVEGAAQMPNTMRRPQTVAPVERASAVLAHCVQGYAPLSVSWLDSDALARHWAACVTGCTHAARRARPQDWRVARSVIVHPDPAQAEAMAKHPDSPCRAYYRDHAAIGADDAAIDALIDGCVLYGTATQVLAKLRAITDVSVWFGTLVVIDHDWPDAKSARQSLALLADALLSLCAKADHGKTQHLEFA